MIKIDLECNDEGQFSMPDHPMRRSFDDVMAWMDGRLLAHDVVEHVDGYQNIGTVEDELQALGAVWYTRGRWGDDVTDEGIISDIVHNLSYVPDRLLSLPRTLPNKYEIDDFSHMVDESKERFFANEGQDYTRQQRINSRHNLEQVMGWMVKGYRKAKKKYGRYSRFTANNLFNNIKTAVDECQGYPGIPYVLKYTIKTAQATIEENWELDLYE